MESESSSSEASSASSKNRSGTTSTKSSFLALVSEVPLVQSTLAKTSSVYSSTKERNLLTKIGFSAAEVSLQTAFATTKFAYRWVPSFGVFGSLKEGIHKKVEQVDLLACYGLRCVQKHCPILLEDTDKVLASGTETLKKSEVLEFLLVVTEALVDYIHPDEPNKDKIKDMQEENGNVKGTNAPRTQTKLHRIEGISRKAKTALKQTVVGGGKKFLYSAASFPGMLTKTGISGVKTAFIWTWDTTGSALSIFPVMLSEMKHGRKLQKSKRTKQSAHSHRLLTTTNPFPVTSPDKKRKRNQGNTDEATIYELLCVDETYVSEEDPDFDPQNAEEETSSSSAEEESGEEEEDLELGEIHDITHESEANSSQALASLQSAEESVEQIAGADKPIEDPDVEVPCGEARELKGRIIL